MIKILRNLILITIHLLINFTFIMYKIIHKFSEKYKGKIKKILIDIDDEVKKVIAV